MKEENTINNFFKTIGISGYEMPIREEIIRRLSRGVNNINLKTDRIGNLIYHITGEQKKVKMMIIAHMDEVGFQVMNIDDEGNAILKTLGNIKTWNTFNQKVSTSNGKKKAVLYCENPQNIEPYEFGRIKCIPTKGVLEIGDVLGFENEFIETEKYWIGKAIDNRVSCFLLSQIISSGIQSKYDIDFVFSVQEEIGMRGARVAITERNPDIIIDVDVSAIGKNNSLKLGNGVGIKLSDSIGVSSDSLVKQIEKYALEKGILYQQEVSDCGTSELIITNEKDSGALRVGVSIPCQNMHSPMSMVNRKDTEACQKLLESIIQQGLEVI